MVRRIAALLVGLIAIWFVAVVVLVLATGLYSLYLLISEWIT